MTPEEQRDLDTRLIDAADRGDTKAVQTLLASGANVHAWDDAALCVASQYGNTATVQMLLANGANVHGRDDDALRWTAYWGYTETVKVLLASGADVHADNDWALRWAAQEGHTATVQVLQAALRNEQAQRLELERRQNPLYAGTGLTFAESRLEDMDALLREAITEQSAPQRPDGREYIPLPLS